MHLFKWFFALKRKKKIHKFFTDSIIMDFHMIQSVELKQKERLDFIVDAF